MVKTRISGHAKINRDKLKDVITNIFGRTTLALVVVTETVDAFGQLTGRSEASTTFTGDLQFGPDLDERFVSTGMVEIGDAVLYIHPTDSGLSTLPKAEDIISDSGSNSKWEIFSQIESPELGGAVVHFSYRCKRLIESSDESQ
jgi:hypothetical protein